MNKQRHVDAELILRLGGPAKVAELLRLRKKGGAQRVQNWMTRGIPARVKLDHYQILMLSGLSAAGVAKPKRSRLRVAGRGA